MHVLTALATLDFDVRLSQFCAMLVLARVAAALAINLELSVSASMGGWQADGFHVYPGDSIEQALDAVAHNATNKTVKVHAGTYFPDGQRQALIWFNRVHDGVILEAVGTVTLTAANPALSPAGSQSYPAVVNHVVFFGDGISSHTVMRGFKITGANNFVTTKPPEIELNGELKRSLYFYADGGAVKIYGRSTPTLQQLEISDNYSSPCAGGISIEQGGTGDTLGPETVRIENCLFRQNRSQVTGAAVDLLPGSSAVISNCLFVGNIANLGVNYISPNQAQPEFTNSAPLTVFPTSRAIVQRCTFTGNRNGVEDLGGHSQYQDCIFWRNNLAGSAFYAGERYELCAPAGARVVGCLFGGPVLDPLNTISKTENHFDCPDPQFDSQFHAQRPVSKNVGFHLATD